MTFAFLVVSALTLVLVLNALRPLRQVVFALGSFLAGWVVAELAPALLAVHLLIGLGFGLAGAVDGAAGVVALALWAAGLAGYGVLVRNAWAAGRGVDAALVDALGDDYRDRIPPERAAAHDPGVPWRVALVPFLRRGDVVRHRNIQYAGTGRRGRLDVYHRADRPAGCPTLLQIHGGAWVSGNKATQGLPLVHHLASRGWVCVSINYRLSPRHPFPAQIVDVKRAIAWIREHGPAYGCDPEFIAVSGGSAGGHLAALAALTAGDDDFQPGFEGVDTSLQAAVPYYGVYDLADDAGTRAGRDRLVRFLAPVVFRTRFSERTRARFEAASPLRRVRPDAPPFFVIHGRHDTLVPVKEARTFADRLRAVSAAPVAYAEIPGAQHAFDVFPSIRTAHVIRAVERFLDYAYGQHISSREDRHEGRRGLRRL